MIWEEIDFDYSSFLACFIKDYFTYDEMYTHFLPTSNLFYQFIIDDPFLNQYLIFRKNLIFIYNRIKGIVINKKMEGEWKYYYLSGKLRIERNYKNGEREGEWKEYYYNGQLESIKNYKNGTTFTNE